MPDADGGRDVSADSSTFRKRVRDQVRAAPYEPGFVSAAYANAIGSFLGGLAVLVVVGVLAAGVKVFGYDGLVFGGIASGLGGVWFVLAGIIGHRLIRAEGSEGFSIIGLFLLATSGLFWLAAGAAFILG
jgi:hypothetical protein